jgi:hypothetical protein
MASLLDIESLRQTKLETSPFTWGICEKTFTSDDVAEQLTETFPAEGFGQKHRRLGESAASGGHRLNGRALVIRETGEVFGRESLHPLWQQLTDELKSPEYGEAISELIDYDLSRTQREVILFRQGRGYYLDPHSDNAQKPCSHAIYLNDPTWSEDDGGCLRLLRSRDIDDVVSEVEPRRGRSFVLKRSDNSWHGYPPVKSDKLRLSIQVFFCLPEMQFTTEYGPDWTKPARVTRSLKTVPDA